MEDARTRSGAKTANGAYRSPEMAPYPPSRADQASRLRSSADYYASSSTDRYALPSERSFVERRPSAVHAPHPLDAPRAAYPPSRSPHYSLPMREDSGAPKDHYMDRSRMHAPEVYNRLGYEDAQPTFFMPSHYDYQQGKTRKRSNLPKQSTEIMKTWFDQVSEDNPRHRMIISLISCKEHYQPLPFRGPESDLFQCKYTLRKTCLSIKADLQQTGYRHQYDSSEQLVHQPPPPMPRTARQAGQDARGWTRRRRLKQSATSTNVHIPAGRLHPRFQSGSSPFEGTRTPHASEPSYIISKYYQTTTLSPTETERHPCPDPRIPVHTRPCFVHSQGPDRQIDRLPAAADRDLDLNKVQL